MRINTELAKRLIVRMMPRVLMQLMPHESIDTTMRFYAGRRVQATADVVWDAYRKTKEQPKREKSPERDTLRDSDAQSASTAEELKDAS